MTDPSYHPTVGSLLVQVVCGYLIFALTASSISMWLAASYMKASLRGYAMSLTYMSAAVVIYYNTALFNSIAGFAVVIAAVGPWAYHRPYTPKKK